MMTTMEYTLPYSLATGFGKCDLHEDIGGEFTYDGLIDSTGIWATQLNEAQVAALYNNGNGLPYDQF